MTLYALFALPVISSIVLAAPTYADELYCAKFAKDRKAHFEWAVREKGLVDYLEDLGNIGWGPYGDNHDHWSKSTPVDMTLNNGVLTVEAGNGRKDHVSYDLKQMTIDDNGRKFGCTPKDDIHACMFGRGSVLSKHFDLIELAKNSDGKSDDLAAALCLESVLSAFSLKVEEQVGSVEPVRGMMENDAKFSEELKYFHDKTAVENQELSTVENTPVPDPMTPASPAPAASATLIDRPDELK